MIESNPPPQDGIVAGFGTEADVTPQQVAAFIAEHRADPDTPLAAVVDEVDNMAAILARLVKEAGEALAEAILEMAQGDMPKARDGLAEMMRSGVRITIDARPGSVAERPAIFRRDHRSGEVKPAPGAVAAPLIQSDSEMIDIRPSTLAAPACSVVGCELLATKVVRSLKADTGAFLCDCHAAIVEVEMKKARGG